MRLRNIPPEPNKILGVKNFIFIQSYNILPSIYGVSVRCRSMFRQVLTSSLDRGSKLRGVIGCVEAPYGG